MHFYCIRRVCSVEAGTFYTDGAFESLVSALNEVLIVVCGVVFCFDSETYVETDVETDVATDVETNVEKQFCTIETWFSAWLYEAIAMKENQKRTYF